MILKDFSKACGEKWKVVLDLFYFIILFYFISIQNLPEKDKKKFNDMAARDKLRYQKEMESYIPPPGEPAGRKRKKTKDPNAPKRYLSAFFMFCNEKRPDVQKAHPEWRVGDVAKELGKMWEAVQGPARDRYEQLAAKDKERYEKEMSEYNNGKSFAKKPKSAPVQQQKEEEDEADDGAEYDDDEDDEDDAE